MTARPSNPVLRPMSAVHGSGHGFIPTPETQGTASRPAATPLKNAWPLIRNAMRRQMSDFAFAFVNDAHLITLDENLLELSVGTRLVADWLEERYRKPILDAVKEVTGYSPTLKLSISGFLFRKSRETERQIRAEAAAELSQSTKPTTQRVFAKRPQIVPLDPQKTFGTFVVGDSNRLAHNIALQIVKHPGAEKSNPFFIHGPTGVGKTHLLQAIAQKLSADNPALNVLYVPYDYFLGQYVSALANKNTSDGARNIDTFRQQFRGVDVLLVDEMQQMESKRHSQDEFLHTFNDLIGRGKQVILGSSLPPRALQKVTPQLINRFEAGLVARLDVPDRATRHGIITQRLKGHTPLNTPPILEFLADNLSSDVHVMGGQLNKLACFLSLYQQPITLQVVQTVLSEVLPFNKRILTLNEVETAVVRQFGITSADLHSSSRKRHVAFARQVCMYLARRLTNFSLNEIGVYFGGKNHATVVFSENKIKARLAQDADLAKQVDQLIAQLRA